MIHAHVNTMLSVLVFDSLFFLFSSATGEEVTIFVPKDEEPKTDAERIMKALGFKKVDKNLPNIGIGITGVVMMIIPVVLLIASDLRILRRHFKMMSRNLKEGYQRFIRRKARVAPEPARTGYTAGE